MGNILRRINRENNIENKEFRYLINSEFYTGVLLTQLAKKHNICITYDFGNYVTFGAIAYTGVYENDGHISISKHFIQDKTNTYNDIKGILLHEIAHILDKNENSHNEKWKKLAKSIGMEEHHRYCTFKVRHEHVRYYLKCEKGCTKKRFRKTGKQHHCKRHRLHMEYKPNKRFKSKVV